MHRLRTGLSHTENIIVTLDDTAASYGSGLVEVFATPAMIALMEQTCLKLALPFLEEGFNTVGTEVNVKHIKASPVGKRIHCTAILEQIDGKQLIFSVKASDEDGEIGYGTHTRFIINTLKFMEKLRDKP